MSFLLSSRCGDFLITLMLSRKFTREARILVAMPSSAFRNAPHVFFPKDPISRTINSDHLPPNASRPKLPGQCERQTAFGFFAVLFTAVSLFTCKQQGESVNI